jgi:hypothetical protein
VRWLNELIATERAEQDGAPGDEAGHHTGTEHTET